MVFKKLLQHLATRGTYSPGDWRRNEAWREQTLVYSDVPAEVDLLHMRIERHEDFLSGVPDYFGRNKISSGGDLSHYSSASLY